MKEQMYKDWIITKPVSANVFQILTFTIICMQRPNYLKYIHKSTQK